MAENLSKDAQVQATAAYRKMLYEMAISADTADTSYNLEPGQRVMLDLPIYVNDGRVCIYGQTGYVPNTQVTEWSIRVPFRYIPAGICNALFMPVNSPLLRDPYIQTVRMKEPFFISETPFPWFLVTSIINAGYFRYKPSYTDMCDVSWYEACLKREDVAGIIRTAERGNALLAYGKSNNPYSQIRNEFNLWFASLHLDFPGISEMEMAFSPCKEDFIYGIHPSRQYSLALNLGSFALSLPGTYSISRFGVVIPNGGNFSCRRSDSAFKVKYNRVTAALTCLLRTNQGSYLTYQPSRYSVFEQRVNYYGTSHYVVMPANKYTYTYSKITFSPALFQEHLIAESAATIEDIEYPKIVLSPVGVYCNGERILGV